MHSYRTWTKCNNVGTLYSSNSQHDFSWQVLSIHLPGRCFWKAFLSLVFNILKSSADFAVFPFIITQLINECFKHRCLGLFLWDLAIYSCFVLTLSLLCGWWQSSAVSAQGFRHCSQGTLQKKLLASLSKHHMTSWNILSKGSKNSGRNTGLGGSISFSGCSPLPQSEETLPWIFRPEANTPQLQFYLHLLITNLKIRFSTYDKLKVDATRSQSCKLQWTTERGHRY